MADEVPPSAPSDGNQILAAAAELTLRGAAFKSICLTPLALAVHATSWGIQGLLGGAPRSWSWGRELFGAAFVSFFAIFLLRWWGRRRSSRRGPIPPKP